MCGIVAGISTGNVVPVLLEGLKRLEYRGYDSAGIAVLDAEGIKRARALGRIKYLEEKVNTQGALSGRLGIAHTRWATHGRPEERNAHPHICNEHVAVVHNGIIENFQALKSEQATLGYRFTSDTDTEVIAHAVDDAFKQGADSLLKAVQQVLPKLKGAYALAVMSTSSPEELVVARSGSPLVLGVAEEGVFAASDVSALLPVTQRFIFLEEGDVAVLISQGYQIYDQAGKLVEREVKISALSPTAVELGRYQHFMHKEIHEQPQAVVETLEGRVTKETVLVGAFGSDAEQIFAKTERVQIVACGTSFHAGLVAKYWFEDIIRMPCSVEVASEFRYRNPVLENNTLFIAISQSGETADTLAALRLVVQRREQESVFMPTLSICNVAESSLTRESDLVFLTHAGPEIGVASTKAFTTQLVALALLLTSVGKVKNKLSKDREQRIVEGLHRLPGLIQSVFSHEKEIAALAKQFADKEHALFLGRGTHYPIAMEGALKLKEVSYIHAEAYPAGELKHGPLALIDEKIPVIAIAPKDELLEKLKSNLEEVAARGGKMIVFEDEDAEIKESAKIEILKITRNMGRITAPVVLNISLQILSYYVALVRGTDVDKPRNLAKSVTVE